jgi:hypothetical protein
MTVFQQQLQFFYENLTSRDGIIGVIIILMLIVGHFAFKDLKWWIMPLILWCATLSFQVDIGETRAVILAPPLEQLQLNARPLCLALIFTLLVPTFLASRGWRRHLLGAGVLAFFFFEIVLGARIAMSDASMRGQLSLVVYGLLFVTFAWGLARWLQGWVDARKAVRVVVIAGAIFVLGTAYQLLMARTSIVRQNRLYGTAGNPQHAGMVLAMTLPPLCYLIIRKGQRYVWRLSLGALGGVASLMLLWTGSRTGILVALTGLLLFFRTRIGRLLGVAMIASIFVLAAMQIYTESTAPFSEMFLRGDTRSHVWSAMLEQFWNNPAMGAMGESFGVGENSYLAIACSMGLTGLIPIAIAYFFVGRQLWRLQRVRKQFGEHLLLADLVTASLVSFAVGAMFEGYLLGTITFPVLNLYINLILLRFLLDAAEVMQQQQPPDESGGAETFESQGYEGYYQDPQHHEPALLES